MHRSIVIVAPTAAREELRRTLAANEHVLSLALYPDTGVKPEGDVFAVHVLNLGADEVMLAAESASKHGDIAITTEESSSFVHPGSHAQVIHDRDEGQWEEMETGLRHQGRATPNFVVLCACGGAVAAVGLLERGTAQATLLIAASIIAPVYEPVVSIALGAVLRDGAILKRGLLSTLIGYAALITAAGLSFALLRSLGGDQAKALLAGEEFRRLTHATTLDLVADGAAGIAGGTMVASFRRSVMAGPLAALAIVPAAAGLGMTLAIGREADAGAMLARLGLDFGLIIGAGVLVFLYKRLFVHRRDALV